MSDNAVTPARAIAARKLARLLASEDGRQLFARNKYVSGTPVIPANEDESIASVMLRVVATGSTTSVLAVHFPDRTGDRELVVFELTRTAAPKVDPIETGRGTSTIGMLVDSVNGGRGSMSIAAEAVIQRFEPVAA